MPLGGFGEASRKLLESQSERSRKPRRSLAEALGRTLSLSEAFEKREATTPEHEAGRDHTSPASERRSWPPLRAGGNFGCEAV